MPRIRYLKPDFFKDENIKDLSFEARLFYQGLWCMADKEGRLEDRPERLKVEIMPYDNIDVEKLLSQLEQNKNKSDRPFIVRYEINGEKYIQILKWHEHQRIHHTEKESKIPPPNKEKLKSKSKGKGKSKAKTNKLEISNRELTVNSMLKTEKIIKKVWNKYGLVKHTEPIWKNKIRPKLRIRLKNGYTVLQIAHAIKGMKLAYESPKSWWSQRKELFILLEREEGAWIDKFSIAYIDGFEATGLEVSRKEHERKLEMIEEIEKKRKEKRKSKWL